MRAATYQAKDQPLVIENVPDPTPRPDEVILKVANAGICGSDLHMKHHGRAAPGTVFGHEFAGEIVAMGRDAGDFWSTGMRATALPLMPCRHCDACDAHLPALCETLPFIGTSLERLGAYSQFVAVRSDLVQPLPQGVSLSEGALVEPLAVAHHAVELAGVRSGHSVLVVGAGPVGAAVALFARMKGARHVIVSELSAERRALAMDMGASATIDPAAEDVAERFHALTGQKPEIVFECVGAKGMIQQAVKLAAVRGMVVVAGVYIGEDPIVPILAMLKEVTIRFSQAYTEADFAAVIDAIAQRRAIVTPMHTRTVGFADLPAAFEELSHSPRDCKVLLEPEAG